MPGVDGPETDALYALGAGWLKGRSRRSGGEAPTRSLRHPCTIH